MRIIFFAMSVCTYPSVLIDGLFLFKYVSPCSQRRVQDDQLESKDISEPLEVTYNVLRNKIQVEVYISGYLLEFICKGYHKCLSWRRDPPRKKKIKLRQHLMINTTLQTALTFFFFRVVTNILAHSSQYSKF